MTSVYPSLPRANDVPKLSFCKEKDAPIPSIIFPSWFHEDPSNLVK
ncbi:hypothetical protein N8692_04610 [Flavobacteriales bacterium]|nr:hypothetical protein [Flavobacteriales bacterium]